MILIVGAGFSGAVIAYKLANAGYQVTVVDKRTHLAGNCHTERDIESGVMLHKYGPHIFHTDNKEVWDFLSEFTEFMNYTNRVKATISDGVFSLPINLHTINQLFRKSFSPQEAQDFITSQADTSIVTPISFEDQALKFVGERIYNSFFKGYTKKQWGMSPKDLPASILKRLPVRFNYDDNYFNHKYQGMPVDGYTEIVRKMLTHPNIIVELERSIYRSDAKNFKHVFYSGALDEWFDYSEGRLAYRTLDFEELRGEGDIQGCAVMNYCDERVPYTRIAEHKHFAPWESHAKSIAYREYSRECGENDVPYYPIRLVKEQNQLRKYIELAKKEKGVSFIGRLGTYRYLDMDITIAEALNASKLFLQAIADNNIVPAFFVDPLKKPISILVATHKNYEFPKDSGYQPIQVGRAISNSHLKINGDDIGENISELNKSFCEITGMYWMWKNVSADAYGLSHYRRYFSPFSSAINVKGVKIATTQSIQELLNEYDIILSKPRNYWIETVKKHYANAHISDDLKIIENILAKDYPEYLSSYEKLMCGTKLSLYNMFAMKSDNFNRYCTWLFDILFKAKSRIPYETYGPYQGRVFGFLAERLLNVWVLHNISPERIKYQKVTNIEGENILQKAIGLLQRKFQGIKQD